MTLRISGLSGLLVYLGLGFLVHLIFIGTNIVWSSAFALFVILLWPFYLIYLVGYILLWFIVAVVVIFVGFVSYELFEEKWRNW